MSQVQESVSDAGLSKASSILDTKRNSIEVTGLGAIASVIVAFSAFVTDGTLSRFDYSVFVLLLLVGAGGLSWRMWKRR